MKRILLSLLLVGLTANQARIADGANDALRTIYEDDQFSAQAAISRSQQKLDELATLDPRLSAITALLAQAEIQVTEAAESLRAYLGGLESDPGRLQERPPHRADHGVDGEVARQGD